LTFLGENNMIQKNKGLQNNTLFDSDSQWIRQALSTIESTTHCRKDDMSYMVQTQD